MKYLILFVLFCSMMAVAQKPAAVKTITPVEQSEVPSVVVEKFTAEFPDVQATWSRDGDNYRATFVNRASRLSQVIVYDRAGKVLRRESQLDKLSAPGAINEYHQKPHPNGKFISWDPAFQHRRSAHRHF